MLAALKPSGSSLRKESIVELPPSARAIEGSDQDDRHRVTVEVSRTAPVSSPWSRADHTRGAGMHYIAQAQHPTSVTDALKCDLLEPGVDCLVVCKYSRLEIHTLEASGLKLVWEESLFGAVEHLCAVKPKDASLSSLLIVTSSLKLFSLALDPSSTPDRPRLITTSSVSLARKGTRVATELVTTAVDPHGRCTASHVLDGELYIVNLKHAASKVDVAKGFSIRIPEHNVYSLEFASLPESVEPTLVYLSSDHTGRTNIRARTLDIRHKSFDDDLIVFGGMAPGRHTPGAEWQTGGLLTPDDSHKLLIPVASVSDEGGEAGVIVVGEESAVFLGCGVEEEDSGQVRSKGKGKAKRTSSASDPFGKGPVSGLWSRRCNLPVGDVKCWANVNGRPDEFLIGDMLGKLHLLRLIRNPGGNVDSLVARDLGDVSAPERLVHLESGFVFVGSHSGDSQLVTIPHLSRSGQAETRDDDDAVAMDVDDGIDVVATWTNLAPIVDFCVVDEAALGQSYLVTCSGLQQDGSLRLVRHGVGLKDLGALEWAGVQRVWPVRIGEGEEGGPAHDALVLSFVDETRVLLFQEDGIEEVEDAAGFEKKEHTLAAGMAAGVAVQVTPSAVRSRAARWTSEGGKKITVTAMDGQAVVVATEGGELARLDVSSDGSLVPAAKVQLGYDVACLDVSASLGFVAAGQWTANDVLILSLADLSVVSSVSTDSTFHLRSVLLASFTSASSPVLFIGLGDGSLVTTSLDRSSGRPHDGGRRSVALGTRPITMTAFTASEGVPGVLINSDRPTIATFSNDRVRLSSVNVAGVVAATSFDAKDFGQSLVLATAEGMRIVRVDELQRVHVATLPLEGEQPRRIAHSERLRAFGIVCVREELDRETGEEGQVWSFKIIDDASFAVLLDFAFEENEQGLSVRTAVLVGDDESECFIVGTAVCEPSSDESTHGRVLAFRRSKDGDATYTLAHSVDALGAVHDVRPLPGGRLAACSNAFVHIFQPSPAEPDRFEKVASWGGAFVSLRLAVVGAKVLVSDAFRSVVVLDYDVETGHVRESARDYNAYGARAVAVLEEGEFIASDVDLNVFTVGLADQNGTQSVVKTGGLAALGRFHVGEYVTTFAQGSLVPRFVGEHAPGRPRLVYATSTGAIGVVVRIEGETAGLLTSLERNMRGVIKGLGDIDHAEYRTFKKDKRDQDPAGFVDGDFVQRFIDLSSDEHAVARIMEGGSAAERLAVPKAEIIRTLEELARLH